MKSLLRRARSWTIAGVILLGVGAVVIAARGRPEWDPETLANQVKEAINSQHWSRAESLLNRLAARRTPTSADKLLRAEVESDLGRADVALTILGGLPESDPLAPRARLLASQIERRRDRMRLAEAWLLESLRLDPKLIQARRELVYLYGMQARRAEMNAQFLALSELLPLYHDDMLLWTSSHEDIWIQSTIIPDLERFLAADPEDRWSRLALAEVLLVEGDLDRSETLLGALPESDAEALALRARLALNRSELAKAQALLAHGPIQHAGLARLRGQVAILSNDPSTAARELRIAVQLEPTNREAVQRLALALQLSGKAGEAAVNLRQAERLRTLADLLEQAHDPKRSRDRTLPRRLGDACAAVGYLAEARGWYRIAIGHDPLDADVQAALYRLRERPHESESPPRMFDP